MNKYQPLFTPIKIGNVTIKNRYAQSPMTVYSFDPAKKVITSEAVEYFAARARGGVGLIFTGAMSCEDTIEKNQPFPVLTYNPRASKKMIGELAEKVHAYGAKLFVQITLGMGRNTPTPSPNPGDNIAPSENANYYFPNVIHRALTTKEVYGLIDAFGKAAAIAKAGGADGIEVHSMHGGYLLDAFTMSTFNHRTDEFGGDLKGRCTLPIKVLEAVKENCGSDFPVSIRYAVKSFARGHHLSALPGEEFTEMGRDTAESLEMAAILDEAGYDCFNVDCGSYDGDYWGKPPVYMPAETYLPYSEMMKKVVKAPVLVSGKLADPDAALRAVTEGKTDMVVLGRPLFADPELPMKVQTGHVEDIRPCVYCHDGCVKRRATTGLDPSCAINPCANRETLVSLTPALQKKKVLIAGGGPVGMEAAMVLAQRGHDVVLADKDDALGGKYRFAALPGFKEADEKLVAWFEHTIRKLGVKVMTGHVITADDPLVEEADLVICATGADSAVPPIAGIEKASPILEVLKNKAVDENAEYTVIGGGLVGCEFAIWLAKQGISVHVVEMAKEIVPNDKPAKMNLQYITEALKYYKVDVRLGTKLLSVEDNGIWVEKEDKKEFINTQKTVYSLGFRSVNTLYDELTSQGKEVYNIGDSKHPGTIMPGIWDAFEICRNL